MLFGQKRDGLPTGTHITKLSCGRTIPGQTSYSSIRFDAEIELSLDDSGNPEKVVEARAKLIQFVDASLKAMQAPVAAPEPRQVASPPEPSCIRTYANGNGRSAEVVR
jgi:hypothetical protein